MVGEVVNLDDYDPLGEIVAGFNTWSLHALDTGDVVEGLALTEVGDTTFGIVLNSPSNLAEPYFERIVAPAMEAFVTTTSVDATLEIAGIDIGGRNIAFATGGSGEVTVVFEAGLGNGMASWGLVAPDVAELSKVFAYDRPGYGASDPTDTPRDAATMMAELRDVLIETGHEPPYVLVGHSLGGSVMDLFARTHPDEVAGVVLVDSRHHDFTEQCLAQLSADECLIPSEDVLAEQFKPHERDEWLGLEVTSEQLDQAPGFPEVPLAVIVAGISEQTPAFEALWNKVQQDYADMAPDSELIVAENSSHNIPGLQPELIVDTIAQLTQQQR